MDSVKLGTSKKETKTNKNMALQRINQDSKEGTFKKTNLIWKIDSLNSENKKEEHNSNKRYKKVFEQARKAKCWKLKSKNSWYCSISGWKTID